MPRLHRWRLLCCAWPCARQSLPFRSTFKGIQIIARAFRLAAATRGETRTGKTEDEKLQAADRRSGSRVCVSDGFEMQLACGTTRRSLSPWEALQAGTLLISSNSRSVSCSCQPTLPPACLQPDCAVRVKMAVVSGSNELSDAKLHPVDPEGLLASRCHAECALFRSTPVPTSARSPACATSRGSMSSARSMQGGEMSRVCCLRRRAAACDIVFSGSIFLPPFSRPDILQAFHFLARKRPLG